MRYVDEEGVLSDGDRYYGADSRKLSLAELDSILSVPRARLDRLFESEGGEAEINFRDDFDADEYLEGWTDEDGTIDELRKPFWDYLHRGPLHIEVNGAGWFGYHLSILIAFLRKGAWEDPSSGEWEFPNEPAKF